MRIMWISHASALRGAERCYYEGVRALHALGLELHGVFPLDGPLIPMCSKYIQSATVVYTPWWGNIGRVDGFLIRMKRMMAIGVSALKLSRRIRAIQPDLVVTNSLVIPSGALAAARLGIPHVWYIHEYGQEDHGFCFDLGFPVSVRLMKRLSRRIIVNSESVKDKFANYFPTAIMDLVYCAVEVEESGEKCPNRRDLAEPLRLIILGTLGEGKRQEDAIRAIQILKHRGKRASLQIVGGGDADHRKYLENLVQELDVRQEVEFVAETPTPLEYIKRANALLMCSRSEAFGRVTIEAMKLGRPVIGANAGATPSLVADGKRGYVYEPKNSRDLAEKIERLIDSPQLLEKMGNEAYTWSSQNFTIERYGEQLLGVFQKTLKGSRSDS